MSSDNYKQYSPGDSTGNGSMTESGEQQEKKVCFICGRYTELVVNIHEPRRGPNMIEVISKKFNMQPLDDDKFLCYNCNNWLVNWYMMQPANSDSSHEDAQQTASSTMSTTTNAHEQTTTKTSDDRLHIGTNELVIVSDEYEDDENVDVNNVIQTLRNRLKKYLYHPNKQKTHHNLYGLHAHPDAAVNKLNESPQTHQNCERCGKLIRTHSNRRRRKMFCRHCRQYIAFHSTRSKRRQRAHVTSMMSTRSETSTPNNRINIFEKLQQLGTSIYYETECKGNKRGRNQHMISIPHPFNPHEMDTNTYKRPMNTWTRPTNESNEILMTFNTVVTEVFPIEQLNSYHHQEIDQRHATTEQTLNIQEILRNVPKSLTITIA